MTNAFESGYEFGAKVGGALGNAQRKKAYGDQYQQGGWKQLGEFAGANGDLETANQAQTQVTNQEETAFKKATRNMSVLGNAVRGVQSLPYEQRKARVQQIAPMLQGLGLDAQQIASYDPTDENNAAILAQLGEYGKYRDYKEVDGVLYGIGADGTTTALTERKQKPLIQSDLGDRIDYIDPDTNEVVRTESKGAAPKVFADRDSRPKAPAGYRYTADDNLEAIPGGPAAVKQEDRKRKADAMRAQLVGTSENVLNAIDTAEKLASGWTTGAGAMLSSIPGSKAHDLDAAIDTIVANIGFDKLQEMRAASPTGGALGSVTEKELALLQAVVNSLRQSQSYDQFKANLSRTKLQYQRALAAINAAYEEEFATPGGGAPAPEDPLGIR